MNKKLKIIVSILGGVNTIFSVFIPSLIALIIIDTVALSQINQIILITIALISTLYRGISNLIPLLTN